MEKNLENAGIHPKEINSFSDRKKKIDYNKKRTFLKEITYHKK